MEFSVARLMSSPEFYPVSADFPAHRISFVRMTRNTYRDSSFLDYRTIRADPRIYTVNLDDVLLYEAPIPAPPVGAHYILHSAFCCSTLLARYLDLIPSCFVLKEPWLLTQLAILRSHIAGEKSEGAVQNDGSEEFLSVFNLGLKLLSRTCAEHQTVIVKVNDICNPLGNLLLKYSHQSRIVFLSSSLRTFLLAVLKSEDRRTWLRERVKGAKHNAAAAPGMVEIDATNLGDAEAGAYLWTLNRAICHDLRTNGNSDRVLAMNGEAISDTPKEALSEIGAFLGLPLKEKDILEMMKHATASRYSKNQSQKYDAKSRLEEVVQLENRWGAEVDKGVEWARKVQHLLGFSLEID
jgi:Sulfotransferase domain